MFRFLFMMFQNISIKTYYQNLLKQFIMRNLIVIFFISFLSQVEAQSLVRDTEGYVIVDRAVEGNIDNSVNSGEIVNGIRTLHFGVLISIDYINSVVTIGDKEFSLLDFTPIKDGEVITVNKGKLTLKFNTEDYTVEKLFVEGINVKGLKCEYIGSH